MNGDSRHQRLMEYFDELCDLEGGEQARRLEELRHIDAQLADEVKGLLEHDRPLDGAARLAAAMAGHLQEGTRLGPFRIESRLGEGGMGVVYRAADERLQRPVALKVLPADGAEQRERLLREARLAAAVSHPNIAAVHEVGEVDGRAFIAMELVEGESLRKRLSAGLPTLDETLRIVREIAAALSRAHDGGVIHRDLKPENVMIAPDGHVKVLDFGLAKRPEGDDQASFRTEEGRIVGTPSYLSPEQATGRPADPRSDLFSLGVMLYEMATGERPFRGNPLELIAAVAHADPPPPRRVNPRVPASLERVISRALAKNPDARYQSARELSADLERPRRRPSLRLLLGAAVVTMGAAAAVLWWRAAPKITVVTDQSLPSWSRAEAVAAFKAGLQLERDAVDTKAWDRYLEAAAADPRLAQPYLRLSVMAMRGWPTLAREYFAKASELRTTLGARDQTVLEAIRPCAQQDHVDNAGCAQRLASAASRRPGDAELQELAGEYYFNAGQLDEAARFSGRAVELDPRYGSALVNLGYLDAYLGHRDEALRAFQRCAEVSPEGLTCLIYRDDVYAEDGRCDLVEADAHQAVAAMPGLARSYALLGDAYFAAGRPPATLREVAQQQLAHAPEAERASVEARIDARLAVLEGDFATVEKRAFELRQLGHSLPDEDAHAVPARLLLGLYRETGRTAAAAAVADDYLARRGAWISDQRGDDFAILGDPTPEMLAAQVRGGRRTAESRATELGSWIAGWKRISPPFYQHYLWIQGWAGPTESAGEAQAAMVELPRYQPLPTFNPESLSEFHIGRTLLLAGRADEALPHLRSATRNCFGAEHPFEWVRAHLFLARAERDPAAACAALQVVISRWGKAQPASISAREAMHDAKLLHCP